MVTKSYLDRIKKISEKEGSRFLLFIIPDKENIETDVEKFKKRHGEIFESFEVLIPQVSLQDYETGNDMHLNVKGHGVFANYILATLK